ncbi:MAG: hypothetical protein EZS28_038363, partial [Streblomastix strix]
MNQQLDWINILYRYYYCQEAHDLANVFGNELSLALNAVTRITSAILAPSATGCVRSMKIHDLPTKKQGNETKIDFSDLTSEEEKQIFIQLNVDPSIGVGKEKIKQKEDDNKDAQSDDSNAIRLLLGEIRFLFNRTEGGAAEQIEIPLS